MLTAHFRGEAGMNDETRCALCQEPIAEGQHKVARGDAWVAHVTCWATDPRSPDRMVPEASADLICARCSKPIRPTESIIKTDADLVHVKCFPSQDGEQRVR